MMRKFGDKKLSEKLLQRIDKEVSKLNDGEYKFTKGGAIEISYEQDWNKIKNITKNGKVTYFDENNKAYDINDLVNGNLIRFRGPLESVFLCCLGKLIDLPWYLDADLSVEEKEKSLGIEFISPISVDSKNRTSVFMGGYGQRLEPGGYSLIDYKSGNLIKALREIYPYDDDNNISLGDLWDWENLVNNYPVSRQKIAKSQSRVRQYCEKLIRVRYNEIDLGKKQLNIEYTNYILLGSCLIDIAAMVIPLPIVKTKNRLV